MKNINSYLYKININSLSTNFTNSYKQNSINSNSSFQKLNKIFQCYNKFNNSNNNKSQNCLEEKIKNLRKIAQKKLYKTNNCTIEKYNSYILEYLLHNENCHIVSVFKDYMISDYIEEFLRRIYKLNESKIRIPKFSDYYKNYFLFFCKPTFNNFSFNEIMQNYGENKAELYYKKNYGNQGLEFTENESFNQSSSEKNKNNNNKNIFSDSIKKNINEATEITKITNTDSTINLEIINEKLEIYQSEKTNNNTINEIINSFKKKKKKINFKSIIKFKKKSKINMKLIMFLLIILKIIIILLMIIALFLNLFQVEKEIIIIIKYLKN